VSYKVNDVSALKLAEACGTQLGDVERNDHTGAAHSKSDTEASSTHLDDLEGGRLDNGTDGLQVG
jgi:hypothetical protein